MPEPSTDIDKCRELFPEIRTFDRWLRSNSALMEKLLNVVKGMPSTHSVRAYN
jgi:hypothetical protein